MHWGARRPEDQTVEHAKYLLFVSQNRMFSNWKRWNAVSGKFLKETVPDPYCYTRSTQKDTTKRTFRRAFLKGRNHHFSTSSQETPPKKNTLRDSGKTFRNEGLFLSLFRNSYILLNRSVLFAPARFRPLRGRFSCTCSSFTI